MPFLLGKKIEMTQVFNEKGETEPATLVGAGPCFITQLKIKAKDGYEATQIGFEKKKENKMKKTENGHGFKFLKEFANDLSTTNYQIGDKIDVSVFEVGDLVQVSGKSKGKGFQGGVKRWGFKGRNQTHGVKHEHRTLGSVGSTDAARVFPGKKMPGRTGFQRKTIKSLQIMKIDKENNILVIRGALPGRRGTLLEIKK